MTSSSDELFLVRLLAALAAERLEAILVGTAGAVLQGVPVMTQDVDFLVRDTPRNREKLSPLARRLEASGPHPVSERTATVRLIGLPVSVDFVFDELPGPIRFEAVRSRAARIEVGGRAALVASLEDIAKSKEAAGRPKDLAQLPMLRAALRVREALEKEEPGAGA